MNLNGRLNRLESRVPPTAHRFRSLPGQPILDRGELAVLVGSAWSEDPDDPLAIVAAAYHHGLAEAGLERAECLAKLADQLYVEKGPWMARTFLDL